MTPRFVAALAVLLCLLSVSHTTNASRASGYLSHMLSGIVSELPETKLRTLIRTATGAPATPTHAQQAGDEQCDLCADNWLFVLAAGGRTGSTTAMSMFNSVPGFEIGGEHMAVLKDERDYIQRVTQTEGARGLAFQHRAHDLHALRCSVQDRMKRLVFGTDYERLSREVRVLGFKEIRYVTVPEVAFIASVFPCARYVFTYRANTTAEVRANGFNGNRLRDIWADAGLLYQHLSSEFPEQMATLEVETLSLERYNQVLQGLLGVSGCSFSQIVHENPDGGYSYIGRNDESAKDLDVLTGECDLSELNFRLRRKVLERNEEKWRELLKERYNDADYQHYKDEAAAGADNVGREGS